MGQGTENRISIVDWALEHARQGRLVFPGIPGTKTPAIKSPYKDASLKESQIISWWQENPDYNICLPGGYEITPGRYLGFVDIDCKENRDGYKTMEGLEILGFEFPETLAQRTPSGGLHLFYYFSFPLKNTVDFLGSGIDTRGFHGYVLGAGSPHYHFHNQVAISDAPEWLSEKFKNKAPREKPKLRVAVEDDSDSAKNRAIDFLSTLSNVESGSRNDKAFKAAAKVKDFGLSYDSCLEVMCDYFKSEPLLDFEEMAAVVGSAYKYGENPQGSNTPQAHFTVLEKPKVKTAPKDPISTLNDKFSFVTTSGGNRILWDTGKEVKHLSVNSFHELLKPETIYGANGRPYKSSELWMESKDRKSFQGIRFDPAREDDVNYYNLWRGWAVSPSDNVSAEAKQSLDLLLEHIQENVCEGDLDHTNWVLSYFAHLFQFPQEKPRTCLALRGRKGVGKNVITECLKYVLGNHYMLAASRRLLLGSFNSHLENLLMFVLDEAYWSGDKAAEGILKDLITGGDHNIERKGHDVYRVKNLMRVIIFGNEEWIVPASDDERRYAVFNVGDKRRGDDVFFGRIMDQMRGGDGSKLLLKYFLDYKITADVHKAPETSALMDQKEQSLDSFKTWWFESLKEGYLVGGGSEAWPIRISRTQLFKAYTNQAEKYRRPWEVSPSRNGRLFKEIAPSSWSDTLVRDDENAELRYRVYDIAPLEVARADWEKFIGGKVKW